MELLFPSAISDALPSPLKSSKRTMNTSRVMSPGTEPSQVNDSTKKRLANSRCFSEIRRKCEEELYEELERHRENMRHGGAGGKTPLSSPHKE